MNEIARDNRLSRRPRRRRDAVGGTRTRTRTRRTILLAARALLAMAALGSVVAEAAPAAGQVVSSAPARPSVAALKHEYLRCDRASSQARLTLEAAAYCGAVSDELLRREFDGDLDLLLAWWRSARQAPVPQSGPGSP